MIAGLTAGMAIQFICHVSAGMIFFRNYFPKDWNPWLWSVVYNGTFLVPKLAITAIAAWILWDRLEKIYPGQ